MTQDEFEALKSLALVTTTCTNCLGIQWVSNDENYGFSKCTHCIGGSVPKYPFLQSCIKEISRLKALKAESQVDRWREADVGER